MGTETPTPQLKKTPSLPEQRTEKPAASPSPNPKRKEKIAEKSQALQALREKENIPNFTPEQKARFEKAFGRKFNSETIQKLIIDDITDIEKKDPGIAKMLLCEEAGGAKKFNALGNHDLEWNVGLKNLVDEKVGSVTLKIHPQNLDKGGNKNLLTRYPEAKKAYDEYKASGTVTYFERKSKMKTQGNFYDKDG